MHGECFYDKFPLSQVVMVILWEQAEKVARK